MEDNSNSSDIQFDGSNVVPEGVQDKLNLGLNQTNGCYSFMMSKTHNYYIRFLNKTYVMLFELPLCKVIDVAYWIHDNIKINGFCLSTSRRKLEADEFVEASTTIYIYYNLPGGMMDDEEDLDDVFDSERKLQIQDVIFLQNQFTTDPIEPNTNKDIVNKREKPDPTVKGYADKLTPEMKTLIQRHESCGVKIWNEKENRFYSRIEFFKINNRDDPSIKDYYETKVAPIVKESRKIKSNKSIEEDRRKKRMMMKKLLVDKNYVILEVKQELEKRGVSITEEEMRILRDCVHQNNKLNKKKKKVNKKKQETPTLKNEIKKSAEIVTKKAQEKIKNFTKPIETIREQNKTFPKPHQLAEAAKPWHKPKPIYVVKETVGQSEKLEDEKIFLAAVDNKESKTLLKQLDEKPKTTQHIEKVFVEDDKGQGSGLEAGEHAKIEGLNERNDTSNIDLKDKEEEVVVEEEIEEEEVTLGVMQLVRALKKSNTYTYDYITSNFAINGLIGAAKVVVSWSSIVFVIAYFYNMFKQTKYLCCGNLKGVLLSMIGSRVLEIALKSFSVLPKYRHVLKIQNVSLLPQNIDSEKREYDNNFKTTKRAVEINFEETSSVGLNIGILTKQFYLPMYWDTTEHVASAELVANVLSPINVNATISPVSLMERISKATNIGSFEDYDRARVFEADVINGSERLAIGIIFHHRCNTLTTNVFNEVFQKEEEAMTLLPTKLKAVKQAVRGSLLWMRKPKRYIPVTIYTALEQMKSSLKASQFRILLQLLKPRNIKLMIAAYVLQWLLRRYTLTYLLLYLGLTSVTLILSLMV